MKVLFNQTTNISTLTTPNQTQFNNLQIQNENPAESKSVGLPSASLSLANFPNISFGAKMNRQAKPEVQFLLAQAKWLKCAYSNTVMILPEEAKAIYEKLNKRPNAQSAINLLQQYQKIMHSVESEIFDIFVDSDCKGKEDFQDILQEHKPQALERLKAKQTEIIHSTDKIISKLSPQMAEQVIKIRNEALESIEKGPFSRNFVLGLIKSIAEKADSSDTKKLSQIYKSWYTLPKSTNDLDAFIVKYSYRSHANIAKRLISGSVATIEHIRPTSRKGDDNLGNYLLVAAAYNSERADMPLLDYIELNKSIKIQENLQKYIDSVITGINDKKNNFYHKSFYPESVKESLQKETDGLINLDTSKLKKGKKT